jgi:hypothetical protein
VGNDYLNYQWELISDLCYFSYEVDPYSGYPITFHEFLTDPAIDSAAAHGVNIHLCVTLFSSHTVFFSDPQSQQRLIDTLLSLVIRRNAAGVNIDFEAVPYTVKEVMNQFLAALANTFHREIPGSVVSIATPAIDPESELDLDLLKGPVDLFMIMGYDYYWNGSSKAGPVGGLFPMTSSGNYSVTRTLTEYLSLGIPPEKILLGVPYYGRQWPTLYQFAPSSVTGYGVALTYSTIRKNGSGYYTPANKHLEYNSLSPYYSFMVNGWNQCFSDDPYSMGKKFDLVNRHGIAGIGIWALGYDDGSMDYWDLIRDRFSDCAVTAVRDTIYDSGGPAFPYYKEEDYVMMIHPEPCEELSLRFVEFDLEDGRDYLSIFDAPDTASLLTGVYTGSLLPPLIRSSSGVLTLHFTSDESVSGNGWKAVWQCDPVGQDELTGMTQPQVKLHPNPVSDQAVIDFISFPAGEVLVEIVNCTGQAAVSQRILLPQVPQYSIPLDPAYLGVGFPGIYLLRIISNQDKPVTLKWVYLPQAGYH